MSKIKGLIDEIQKLKFPKTKEVLVNSVQVSALGLSMIGIYFVADTVILWVKSLI